MVLSLFSSSSFFFCSYFVLFFILVMVFDVFGIRFAIHGDKWSRALSECLLPVRAYFLVKFLCPFKVSGRLLLLLTFPWAIPLAPLLCSLFRGKALKPPMSSAAAMSHAVVFWVQTGKSLLSSGSWLGRYSLTLLLVTLSPFLLRFRSTIHLELILGLGLRHGSRFVLFRYRNSIILMSFIE